MTNNVQNARLVHSFIKQLYTNQTSSRWKKVNKMKHFTVIADLIIAQETILHDDLSFFLLILFQYMSPL